MPNYEQLVERASDYGLKVVEMKMESNARGLIRGNKIGIRKEMPTVDKACVLAEEIEHYRTTVGNILDQSDVRNRKQELLARQWAYQCMIPLDRILQAHYARISGRYELADYLGVTEEFLQAAIDRYTEKYGLYVSVDDRHYIYFEPLRVL